MNARMKEAKIRETELLVLQTKASLIQTIIFVLLTDYLVLVDF